MHKVLVFFLFPLFVALSYALTDEIKRDFVNAHNKYRGLVSNPYAKSMPAVAWDDYLEAETQKHTDKCIWEHSNKEERRYPDGTYVGENLYATSYMRASDMPTAEDTLSSWYGEVKDFVYPNGKTSEKAVTGHYTQVVWANSKRIGCGASFCQKVEGMPFPVVLVACRYLPGGNVNNGAPYESSDKNCKTCAAMGYQCGTYTDNCGQTITCNSCNSSEKCVDNKCTSSSTPCTPKTTCDVGYECGTMDNGCGGTINCGSCTENSKCDTNAHKCVSSCTPKTTCDVGYECGTQSDGCGGTINCGSCASGFTCDTSNQTCVNSSDVTENKSKSGGNGTAVGLGVSFGIIGFIAIVVIVTLILVKVGIFVVGGNGGKDKRQGESGGDMEKSAGVPEKRSGHHKPPSSAPPSAPLQGHPQKRKAPPPPLPPRI